MVETTEGLSVDNSERPNERKTRNIILVVAILLLLGGALRFLMGDHEAEYVNSPTPAATSTPAATPGTPASQPAGNGATQF